MGRGMLDDWEIDLRFAMLKVMVRRIKDVCQE